VEGTARNGEKAGGRYGCVQSPSPERVQLLCAGAALTERAGSCSSVTNLRVGIDLQQTSRRLTPPAGIYAAFEPHPLASYATRGTVLATRQRPHEPSSRGEESPGKARLRSYVLPCFHHRASPAVRQTPLRREGRRSPTARGVVSRRMATKSLPAYATPGRAATSPARLRALPNRALILIARALIGTVAIALLVLGLLNVHTVTNHFRIH
jgi:hypothetical protein